jgi:hypothetical protein
MNKNIHTKPNLTICYFLVISFFILIIMSYELGMCVDYNITWSGVWNSSRFTYKLCYTGYLET